MSDLKEHFKIDVSLGMPRPNCIFKGKYYRITVLSDVLIRLEYNLEGKFNDYPTLFAINRSFKNAPSFVVKEDDKFLNITNDYFILEYEKEKPFEASKLVPDINLRVSLKDTDKMWYYNHPEIRNFKGSTYSFDDINFKLSNGLYSTDGFASINDTMRPVFVSDGSVKKNPSNGVDIYLFMYRDDFGKALSSYFELTGFPNFLPRYALGVWWNKHDEYNENELINLVSKFRESEIPLSLVLLGSNWRGNPKANELLPNYQFDKNNYNNPSKLINKIHDNNLYFGVTLNPGNGLNKSDRIYRDAKDLSKIQNDDIVPINVYNTALINEFYNKEVTPLLNIGVDVLAVDEYNKDYIRDFMLSHYTFTNYKQFKNKRGLILSRNHGIASHRYPVLYSGETLVSWRTLKYLPYFNLTSSNIGLVFWSHDIGGFKKGIEDRELYIRYIELGTFSPIFRLSSTNGKYYKREPWKWDVKTFGIVKDYMRLRHRLIPYIYTESYQYSKVGTPIIRPLYYKHPETYDEPLYKNEYYFGSELFVSPIVDPKDNVMNRVVHRILLPEGTWYDFKTGKMFPGGKRYVVFYKDEDYPVFAKSGAIIPMAVLDNDNLNDTTVPKKLEIDVFPGQSNSYNLYEDDGLTNEYKNGKYSITNINYSYELNNYTLVIKQIEGEKNPLLKRDYMIRFRNTKNAEYINVSNGLNVANFKTRIDNNDLIIDILEASTDEELKITVSGKNIELDAVRLINEDIDEIITDLQIATSLKEKLANIIFSDKEIRRKRIEIRKLNREGLKSIFVKMFIKLLEYISEI